MLDGCQLAGETDGLERRSRPKAQLSRPTGSILARPNVSVRWTMTRHDSLSMAQAPVTVAPWLSPRLRHGHRNFPLVTPSTCKPPTMPLSVPLPAPPATGCILGFKGR